MQPNCIALRLAKIAPEYDPSDKAGALGYIQEKERAGEIATGLLYLDAQPRDLHANLRMVRTPLNALGEPDLCPGSAVLDTINASLR